MCVTRRGKMVPVAVVFPKQNYLSHFKHSLRATLRGIFSRDRYLANTVLLWKAEK
jgi:hypothetical protein